jgi:hypothetical protein
LIGIHFSRVVKNLKISCYLLIISNLILNLLIAIYFIFNHFFNFFYYHPLKYNLIWFLYRFWFFFYCYLFFSHGIYSCLKWFFYLSDLILILLIAIFLLQIIY